MLPRTANQQSGPIERSDDEEDLLDIYNNESGLKSPQNIKYAQSSSGSTLLTNTAFPMLKPNETTGTEQCSPIPEPNHCVPIERDPNLENGLQQTQNTPNTMISKGIIYKH